ncbi:hypothetical protein BDZ45DRAFT_450905 [Acephala macrosclerotiorum]|nr:hypothetical protein BDZ45DRAFT_450905 [Acephala macrosclerotiorum]
MRHQSYPASAFRQYPLSNDLSMRIQFTVKHSQVPFKNCHDRMVSNISLSNDGNGIHCSYRAAPARKNFRSALIVAFKRAESALNIYVSKFSHLRPTFQVPLALLVAPYIPYTNLQKAFSLLPSVHRFQALGHSSLSTTQYSESYNNNPTTPLDPPLPNSSALPSTHSSARSSSSKTASPWLSRTSSAPTTSNTAPLPSTGAITLFPPLRVSAEALLLGQTSLSPRPCLIALSAWCIISSRCPASNLGRLWIFGGSTGLVSGSIGM